MMDMVTKCRQARGERIGTSKLTSEDVREIRVLHQYCMVSQCELARQYDVDQRTIGDIIKRETWRHVA
jgi:hypothetical protein